jgi:thioredoxin-like negative regulator of GroEL
MSAGFYRKIAALTVLAGDPDHIDAKMKLAELYEAMNEPRKALTLVYDGMIFPRRYISYALN